MTLSGGGHLPVFFALTAFVSSTLLFWVQPMFAKMVLPMLGGTPAVWNTCMVFFQAALLAGYMYAHATTVWLGARRQAAVHVGLLALSLLALPISVPESWLPPGDRNPIPWLLALLLVSVGFPFFIVSISNPMLQKWFANTDHPAAKDPYFLYGVSNFGSMLALLGYPVLVEPNLRLADQSWAWAIGYGLLVVMTLGCAVMLWQSPVTAAQTPGPGAASDGQSPSAIVESSGGLTVSRRMRWVMLSFVPSSLLLGVTTALSTDISPIPLLWVIPLAIYLFTFVLVFTRPPNLPHLFMVRALPIVILPLVLSMLAEAKRSMWLLIPLHLLTFFVAAMVCHGELAQDRPPTKYLTEFYLWMSVGGLLGGLFNALVAPIIFDSVAEYPLALVFACLLRPRTVPDKQKPLGRWLDFGLPGTLGALVVASTLGLQAGGVQPSLFSLSLTLGLPVMLCFSFRDWPIRFGLGVGAVMLANGFYPSGQGRVLHAERSFFGVYRIMLDPEEKYHLLLHGSTNHGTQSLDPAWRREPLTYYYRTGPIGQVFAAFTGAAAKSSVAVVGLGTGSLACYGEPGQQWTFYEIDPTVERIARDPRYFTYLRDCSPTIQVVLDDARLSLRQAPDQSYGLIILDAFSSDAIPIHLLTKEAVALYLTKLADDGILAFHISNRYLDLRPVLGDLAQNAGLFCLTQDDGTISEAEIKSGKAISMWVVMARQPADLGTLAQDPRWERQPGRPGATVWTDDFSNILSVFRWK